MRALMSVGLPAPSMMVVFSFSTTTFFASPRSFTDAFSSVSPTSSEITVPPVRVAMSCSMALRRSPKPGALTEATLRMPRMLLTTSVATASPSTSPPTTTTARPDSATASTSARGRRMLGSFLSPRGDCLEPLADDRLREHGGGRRAVAGLVGGVGRDFLHHLRAHVLELVLELDLLRH